MNTLYSFALFSIFALLMYIATHIAIAYAFTNFGLPHILGWFLFGSTLVMIPITVTGLVMVRREGYSIRDKSTWTNRLGFRKLSYDDLKQVSIVISLIGVMTMIIIGTIYIFTGSLDMNPSFMTQEPLTRATYWYLLAWLPFLFFNIFGEELLWRGVVMPRMEKTHGEYAFVVQGLLYILFHLPFGLILLPTFLPILFGLPYIKQKTGNTTTAVIIHLLINAGGFLAISFGLI